MFFVPHSKVQKWQRKLDAAYFEFKGCHIKYNRKPLNSKLLLMLGVSVNERQIVKHFG